MECNYPAIPGVANPDGLHMAKRPLGLQLLRAVWRLFIIYTSVIERWVTRSAEVFSISE
jgi:hypothetical protein